MLKLFKKSKTDEQLVEEIHTEIDFAQEKLLLEAKDILAKYGESDKYVRLSKLGFDKVDGVEQTMKAKKDAALIEYYKINYPFQKFITEDEMDRICDKYNLVYAPISSYLKNVPNKNITEIENAKMLQIDLSPENIYKTKLYFEQWTSGGHSFLSWHSKWQHILPRYLDGNISSEFIATDILNQRYNTGIKYLVNRVEVSEINKQGLFIAAPESHFDKSGLTKHGKYGFMSFMIVEPKDPIVFRYCKGGIQVISKWGLEAADEIVVNEINN